MKDIIFDLVQSVVIYKLPAIVELKLICMTSLISFLFCFYFHGYPALYALFRKLTKYSQECPDYIVTFTTHVSSVIVMWLRELNQILSNAIVSGIKSNCFFSGESPVTIVHTEITSRKTYCKHY